MFRIIYLSTASQLLPQSEIEAILSVSRKNNSENGITGILLYSDGNLLQVLEGEEETVLKLYNKIALDRRHKSIIKVFEGKIKEAYFPNWQMGYSYVEETFWDEHKEFNFFKNTKTNKLDKIIEVFITTFLASHREKIKIK